MYKIRQDLFTVPLLLKHCGYLNTGNNKKAVFEQRSQRNHLTIFFYNGKNLHLGFLPF